MSDASQYELGDGVEVMPTATSANSAALSSNDFYSRLQHATVCTIDDQRLIVLPVSGSPVSPLEWLEQEPSGDRFYFSSRDRNFVVAGSGQAHAVPSSVVMNVIDQLFASSAQGSILGIGLPFIWDASSETSPTEARPAEGSPASKKSAEPLLRISRRLVVQIDNEIRAFLIVADDQSDDLEIEYEQFVASFQRPSRLPTPLPKLAMSPNVISREQWRESVSRALAWIGSDQARKIVLSRRETHPLIRPVEAISLLRAFASKMNKDSAFVYLLDLDTQRTMIGASPELLFRRQGDSLETEAVAGTASRSSFAELHSPKQDREQQIVVDWIESRLRRLSIDVSVTAVAEELPAGTICHRRTSFSASLRPRVAVSEILSLLHPTPAVCGEPMTEARELIAALESSERGMYSGVIGVVGPGYAECAVALRSALIEPGKITFSAGAGLVVGSIADNEWTETEQKIDQLRSLFLH